MTIDQFRTSFNQAIILIISALVLAGAIGIFSSIIVTYIVNLGGSAEAAVLAVSGVTAMGLGYLSLTILVRPLSLRGQASCKLLYNFKTGELLPDVYYSFYHAQSAAEQALRRTGESNPELIDDFRKNAGNLDNRMLRQLIEYLLYSWLRWDSAFVTSSDFKEFGYDTLPQELKDNFLLQTFLKMEAHDIVDRALKQVTLELPEGFRIVYGDRTISIEGKQVKISVGYQIQGLWPVQSMQMSPGISTILDTPINSYFAKKLSSQLGELTAISIMLSYNAAFPYSRWRFIVSRQELEKFHAWALHLSDGFLEFFDMGTLNKRIMKRSESEQFDIMKDIQSKIYSLSGIPEPPDAEEDSKK